MSTIAASTGSVDLANFGLDDPYAEVTIHYTDGTEVTVYVGNETPDGVYLLRDAVGSGWRVYRI